MPRATLRSGREQAISAPAFVGRSRQLDALTRALAAPPAVVLVEGEAGIGKSRLVREYLAGAGANRGPVLVGVCPPYQEQSTLAPVVEALRQIRRQVAELPLSGLAGALRPLFPEWAADLPPSPEPLADPGATRHRLYRALAELIAALGARVLVVEDVHWADDISLEFLLFLATRQQTSAELSLLVTYRPEDLRPGSPLLRLSSRLPYGVTQARLALPPLRVAETAALVSSMLDGAQVPESFISFLHERTDGLPLAVEESVRLLGDRADLVHRNGEWVRANLTGLQVPPTVRDSTLERFQRQGGLARQLLRAASVIGGPVEIEALAAVAGLAPAAADQGVAQALASGLLHARAGGQLAFRHDLSAVAVYEAIPAPARQQLHLRSGRALQQLATPPAARLARHFRAGGDLPGWAKWAEQAADAALASSDHLAAVALLRELSEESRLPVPTRGRLTRKLAVATLYLQVADGEPAARAVRALRAVIPLPGLAAPLRAELRNLTGRLLNQQGEYAAAFAELAQAIPQLGHSPVEAARSMVTLGWPRAGPWPAATHLRWLRRADRLPLASASPADRLGLLVDRAAALLQLGVPAGWQVAAQLPEHAASLEERLHLARGNLNIGDAATHWGWYAQARRLLVLALRLAEADEFTRVREIALANLIRLDWLTGAWEGLPARVAALTGQERTEPAARQEAELVAGLLHAARGEQPKAEERFEPLLGEARNTGALCLELAPAAALARLRLAAGDCGAARKLTDGPIETVSRKRIWVWAADIAPVRVATLLHDGAEAEAQRLLAGFAAGLRGRDAPAPQAGLTTGRAMLAEYRGDLGRAIAGYARAAQQWQALPRPYDGLLVDERRGWCLLAAGRELAGLALLERVIARLRGLGAAGDAGRLAGALRARGHVVSPRWRGGRRGYGDQLSPRELEVVRLVVAGETNRRIAQRLSKAPGTVAEQIRSAMRKLGVSSRTALAVRAVEAGVVAEASAPDPRP